MIAWPVSGIGAEIHLSYSGVSSNLSCFDVESLKNAITAWNGPWSRRDPVVTSVSIVSKGTSLFSRVIGK
jgi:hypothetical protein